MSDIIIDIPSDIAMGLKIPDREALPVLRRELAIHLYAQHRLGIRNAEFGMRN